MSQAGWVQPGTEATFASLTSPRVAAAMRKLELVLGARLDGMVHGDYLGLTSGGGREAAEAREYRPGEDDVRRMDWAVTARTTVAHIRDEIADHEQETWLLIDATASMDFGTALSPGDSGQPETPLEKRDLAVAVVAAIGLLTARGGNRLGALVLTNDGVVRFPARAGRPALYGLLRRLLALPRVDPAAAPPSFAESLSDAARALASRGHRVGIFVVVSDFLDGSTEDEPAWIQPLRRLRAQAPVLAVEVLDPRELELPAVGLLTVVDPETGRHREVATTRSLRRKYAEAAAAQRAGIRAALARGRTRQLTLRTDQDWLREIARFVLATRHRVAVGSRG